MGPCQVGCSLFMPPPFPSSCHLNNGKDCWEGLLNEQNMWLSHAWSLFSQSCCWEGIVAAKWTSRPSVERCRHVLLGDSSWLFMEAQQSWRRYLERAGKSDTRRHAFLHLSSLVSSLFGRQALNAGLQEATMPTTQQLHPADIPHHLLRLQSTPCLVCCVANLLNNHSNSRGCNVFFFVTFQINTLDTFSRPTDR